MEEKDYGEGFVTKALASLQHCLLLGPLPFFTKKAYV